MKKFRFAFPVSAYVVFGLLVLVSAVSIVFAALRLGEVGGMFSVYPVSDALSIAVFSLALIAVLCLALFSSYSFSGECFLLRRLFYKKRIRKEQLIKLLTYEENGVSALYYFGSARGEKNVDFVVISLFEKDRVAFERALKSFKNDIVIESFSGDDSDRDHIE